MTPDKSEAASQNSKNGSSFPLLPPCVLRFPWKPIFVCSLPLVFQYWSTERYGWQSGFKFVASHILPG
uniref:Uncharacterized protein n=1 Tax=Anguilla anguilla TaxID=7936 RepID=A0A0E9W604_ANGAN